MHPAQTVGERRNLEVVRYAGDPQTGNLETPINSSALSKALLNNLPAYRAHLSPFRRALEIGMAHGYFLIGPFAKLGPLRDSDVANLAGLLSTVGLIVILTICLSLYGNSRPPEPKGIAATPQPPEEFKSPQGWNEFAGGFLIGGIGGAAFAYLVIANIEVLRGIATNVL